jgi:hypothetical protein
MMPALYLRFGAGVAAEAKEEDAALGEAAAKA